MGQKLRRRLSGQRAHVPKNKERGQLGPPNRADLRKRFIRAFAGRIAVAKEGELAFCDWSDMLPPGRIGPIRINDPRQYEHPELERIIAAAEAGQL